MTLDLPSLAVGAALAASLTGLACSIYWQRWERRLNYVRRLEMGPGDLFVLKTARVLSIDAHEQLKRAWEAANIVPGSRLIVLECGDDFDVIKRRGDPEPPGGIIR